MAIKKHLHNLESDNREMISQITDKILKKIIKRFERGGKIKVVEHTDNSSRGMFVDVVLKVKFKLKEDSIVVRLRKSRYVLGEAHYYCTIYKNKKEQLVKTEFCTAYANRKTEERIIKNIDLLLYRHTLIPLSKDKNEQLKSFITALSN